MSQSRLDFPIHPEASLEYYDQGLVCQQCSLKRKWTQQESMHLYITLIYPNDLKDAYVWGRGWASLV